MSHRLLPSLPRIKVPIGHIPQRLKLSNFKNPRGRLELIRQMVNRLVREERCEFRHNRAVECRAYMERLIQMGVYRGIEDFYTADMYEWWFVEQDLLDKMVGLLIPRYRSYPMEEPYTNIYRLPAQTMIMRNYGLRPKYQLVELGVLELKGNPFPSLDKLEKTRQNNLLGFAKSRLQDESAGSYSR